MKPGNLGTAQTDAWSIGASDDTVNAKVDLRVGTHARVASGIEAVASHVLVVQVEQVRTLEDLVVVSVVQDLDALVRYKDCHFLPALEQAVLYLVQ